jgi:hypothetical protein
VQAQVRVWIETIPNCKTYGQCFEEHKIDGSVMFLLDDSTLREVGVSCEQAHEISTPFSKGKGRRRRRSFVFAPLLPIRLGL